MPEDMPDRIPDRMPEDVSDRMPWWGSLELKYWGYYIQPFLDRIICCGDLAGGVPKAMRPKIHFWPKGARTFGTGSKTSRTVCSWRWWQKGPRIQFLMLAKDVVAKDVAAMWHHGSAQVLGNQGQQDPFSGNPLVPAGVLLAWTWMFSQRQARHFVEAFARLWPLHPMYPPKHTHTPNFPPIHQRLFLTLIP